MFLCFSGQVTDPFKRITFFYPRMCSSILFRRRKTSFDALNNAAIFVLLSNLSSILTSDRYFRSKRWKRTKRSGTPHFFGCFLIFYQFIVNHFQKLITYSI